MPCLEFQMRAYMRRLVLMWLSNMEILLQPVLEMILILTVYI